VPVWLRSYEGEVIRRFVIDNHSREHPAKVYVSFVLSDIKNENEIAAEAATKSEMSSSTASSESPS
jgi:hypothetical protein